MLFTMTSQADLEKLKNISRIDFYIDHDQLLWEGFQSLNKKVDFLILALKDVGEDWFDVQHATDLKEVKKIKNELIKRINQLEKINITKMKNVFSILWGLRKIFFP